MRYIQFVVHRWCINVGVYVLCSSDSLETRLEDEMRNFCLLIDSTAD